MLLVTASLGRVRFPPPAPPPRVFGNFVELRGGALFLDGKPFHFVGTNIYWLMTRAAQRNYELVEQVLDECVKMGLRVVRTWAFWLGPQNSLHPEGSDTHCSAAGCPIGDRAAEALDFVVDAAGRRGIRLILTLMNFWDEFGGLRKLRSGARPARYQRWGRLVVVGCRLCAVGGARHRRQLFDRTTAALGQLTTARRSGPPPSCSSARHSAAARWCSPLSPAAASAAWRARGTGGCTSSTSRPPPPSYECRVVLAAEVCDN